MTRHLRRWMARVWVVLDVPERFRLTVTARRLRRQWGTYPCPAHFRLVTS